MGKTRAKYLEIKGLLDDQVQAHERQAGEAEAQRAEVGFESPLFTVSGQPGGYSKSDWSTEQLRRQRNSE